MELSAGEIAKAAAGRVIAGAETTRATSFVIDSRLARPGACFFALRDVRDGHDYVRDAGERGARIAVVNRPVDAGATGLTVVEVDNPADALAAIARVARARLAGARVIGITGSAGKTATKDLTAAALARTRTVHASPASYNNEAGVPLTLLGAPGGVDVVVAEMGARKVGNIAELAELAEPDVGVVTQIGLAHAESLGGREGITRVKGELLEALPADGLAVLNADCDMTPALASRTPARVLRAGRAEDADVRVSSVALDDELRPRFHLDTPWGAVDVQLALRGEHQVSNAALAATVALALDVAPSEVGAGLADATGAAHRMTLVRTPDGIVVLDDSYNSSPTSAAAAVRAFALLRVPGRHVAVLGDMLELGAHGDAAHDTIGALTGEVGVDLLVAVGERREQLAAGARRARVTVVTAPNAEAAARAVADHVHPGDAVLVKASRAVGLERVAEALTAREDAP